MEFCQVFASSHTAVAWSGWPVQAGDDGGLRSALGSAVGSQGNLSGLGNPSTCLCAKQTRCGGLLTQLNCV